MELKLIELFSMKLTNFRNEINIKVIKSKPPIELIDK